MNGTESALREVQEAIRRHRMLIKHYESQLNLLHESEQRLLEQQLQETQNAK